MSSLDVQQQAAHAPGTGAGVRVDWAPVPKVNLLPQEILDVRRFRGVQRVLVGAVLGTVAVAGLGVGWAVHGVATARDELQATQARTTQLRAEEAKYADVPRVLARVATAERARTQALGRDVLWYRFFDDLAAATPESVSLTSVTVSMDTASAGPGVAADPLTPGGLGSVAFSGTGDLFPDVAKWLESVATVDGLDGSTLQSATRSSDASTDDVTFSSKIVIDDSALSHRYDGKTS